MTPTKAGSRGLDDCFAWQATPECRVLRSDSEVGFGEDDMLSLFRRNPPPFPQQASWSVHKGQLNGRPIFVRKNQAAKAFAGHRDYRFRVGVAVPLLAPTADGLPTNDEMNQLNSIEDTLTKALEEDQESLHMLAITTGACVSSSTTRAIRRRRERSSTARGRPRLRTKSKAMFKRIRAGRFSNNSLANSSQWAPTSRRVFSVKAGSQLCGGQVTVLGSTEIPQSGRSPPNSSST